MKSNGLRVAILLAMLVISVVTTTQAHPLSTEQNQQNCPPSDPNSIRNKAEMQLIPDHCMEIYGQGLQVSSSHDVGSLGTGGPDTFGYTFDDTVTYDWVSATTDSGVTDDDEVSGAIDIGFDFPFYGLNYDQLYFSTNGLITFGAPSVGQGGSISYLPNNFIAPYEARDLKTGSGRIYYSLEGEAPNRYFIVEWRDVELSNAEFYPGSLVLISFEAILYEKGNILVQIREIVEDNNRPLA